MGIQSPKHSGSFTQVLSQSIDIASSNFLNPGWWYTYPSEKWWSSSVGIFLPNWMEKQNSMVPNHQPVLNISNEQNIMFGYHKSPTDHSTDQSFKILSGPLLADRDSLLSIVRIPQIFICHPLNSTNIMQYHLSIIYSPYIPYMPHIFPIYFLYSPYVPHIVLLQSPISVGEFSPPSAAASPGWHRSPGFGVLVTISPV